MKKPELMAPAGDWTMLTAAVNNGADAVYFGINKLNMRAKAKNFTVDELPTITSFCKEHNVKTYLTLNSIVMEEEISQAEDIICKAKSSGVDMIICWDLAVINLCRKTEMPFCISTQASVSNSSSADFFKSIGAKRIVPARECSLDEIKKIRAATDIEIEVFIHGAMCIAVSGRCFMSHHLFGKSANRGECIQPCRRDYEVKEFEIMDHQENKSLVLGEDYVLSPKDLCTIEFIDKLIEAGIDSFKIEGRKRSPEYVVKVISVYRHAIDLYFDGKLTDEIKKDMLGQLSSVYNRGFSSGFYFDVPSSDEYANIYGSLATTRKHFVGKVLNYYKKAEVVYIRLQSGKIKIDDSILIIGPTTGVAEFKVKEIIKEDVKIDSADKGEDVTIPCPVQVREKDLVYVIRKTI